MPDRRAQLLLAVVLGVLLFGGGVLLGGHRDSVEPEIPQVMEGAGERQELEGETDLFVHVTGAVARPGLYRFPPGSRVNDAVEKAEALPGADLQSINLAALLVDGKMVTVPEKETPQDEPRIVQDAGLSGQSQGQERVNINTASSVELQELPGIGPSLAQRIIDYREKQGSFRVPEDLINVSGIGDKRFEQLKDLISTD